MIEGDVKVQYIKCFNCRSGKVIYAVGWEWCKDCDGTGYRLINRDIVLNRLKRINNEATIQCN